MMTDFITNKAFSIEKTLKRVQGNVDGYIPLRRKKASNNKTIIFKILAIKAAKFYCCEVTAFVECYRIFRMLLKVA